MNLEEEIQNIKIRNQKVEQDKAWEKSWTRRIFIGLSTYAVALIWLLMIHDISPWLKAFVPSAGYILSTLSLPVLKRRWIKKF